MGAWFSPLNVIGGGRPVLLFEACAAPGKQGFCPWPAKGCRQSGVMALLFGVGLPPGRPTGAAAKVCVLTQRSQRKGPISERAARNSLRLRCLHV